MKSDVSSLHPDPRHVVADTTVGEWRHFGSFVKRPRLPAGAASIGWPSLVAIGRMWVLDVLLMSALIALAMLVVAFGLDLPESALGKLEWNAQTIALIVVFAPVSEELLFRSWLSGRIGHWIALGVLGLGLVAVTSLSEASISGAALWGFALLVLTIGAAGFIGFRVGKREPVGWFAKLFPVFFWLATLAFALVHLVNYDEGSLAYLLPFVIPQFIGGAIFGYVRVHYGLWASMLIHALHNATALSVAMLGGELAGG